MEGDCVNNFSKKNYSNGHYIGEFKNQNEDGQGTFVWNSGEKYTGGWNTWKTIETPILEKITGKQNIVVLFKSDCWALLGEMG